MAESKTIPSGWTAHESGLLLKGETAKRVRLDRVRRKASVTQDPVLDFLISGKVDSRTRGTDHGNTERKRHLADLISTLRTRDPLIFRTVDYHDKLSIGAGLTWTSTQQAVHEATREIWAANDFDDLSSRIVVELFTSGVTCSRVPKVQPLYIPRVELIPDSQIRQIATTEAGEPWYYTREWTTREFPKPRKGTYQGSQATASVPKQMCEDILADEIVYQAINRGAKDVRGVSPLESMVKWSTLYGRSLESIYMLSAAKSFLAMHLVLEGEDPADERVTAMRNMIDEQLVDRTDLNGQLYRTVPTGQFIVTGEGAKITPLGAQVNAGSVADEVRRLMLMAAVASGTPEVFFSDGDYSNLASSATQANPFFRLMMAFQAKVIKIIRLILRKCFDRLMEHGVLMDIPLEPDMTHPVDYVAINGPDILTPNLAELGPVAIDLTESGVWSPQYACEKLGVDGGWKRMNEETAEAKAQGWKPRAAQVQGFSIGSPSPFDSSAFARARLSADPRHEETFTPMRIARARVQQSVKDLFDAIKKSDGDAETVKTLTDAWRESATAEIGGMIDDTREVGQQHGSAEVSQLEAA